MLAVFRFLFLCYIKILTSILYRHEVSWINPPSKDVWKSVRLVLLLNHTSLFEPLFTAVLPYRFLWRIARQCSVPVADTTLAKFPEGPLFRALTPAVIPISRKRDHTWDHFLTKMTEHKLVFFMPEGRMKRPNGLDKEGKPMTVRGGVVELMDSLREGTMLLAYSGGLHHAQAPGSGIPKPFKTLRIAFQTEELSSFLAKFPPEGRARRESIVKELEQRRDLYCTPLETI